MLLKANRTKYIQSQTINSETQYMYCICFQQFWLGRLPEAMQINKLTKFLLYNLRNHYSQNRVWLKISVVSQAKFFFVCPYNFLCFVRPGQWCVRDIELSVVEHLSHHLDLQSSFLWLFLNWTQERATRTESIAVICCFMIDVTTPDWWLDYELSHH